ncbi:hypothetical protein D083_1867 [Dickeya solani RNS 08.23.3.1.A]|nr:hypothetical protein D083_1867 [Dickeya solani RNS 08.23.3.1.A]
MVFILLIFNRKFEVYPLCGFLLVRLRGLGCVLLSGSGDSSCHQFMHKQ